MLKGLKFTKVIKCFKLKFWSVERPNVYLALHQLLALFILGYKTYRKKNV